MVSERTARAAFLSFAKATTKVKEGSDKYYYFLGLACALGWAVEENAAYVKGVEDTLRELRAVHGTPVENKEVT